MDIKNLVWSMRKAKLSRYILKIKTFYSSQSYAIFSFFNVQQVKKKGKKVRRKFLRIDKFLLILKFYLIRTSYTVLVSCRPFCTASSGSQILYHSLVLNLKITFVIKQRRKTVPKNRTAFIFNVVHRIKHEKIQERIHKTFLF